MNDLQKEGWRDDIGYINSFMFTSAKQNKINKQNELGRDGRIKGFFGTDTKPVDSQRH